MKKKCKRINSKILKIISVVENYPDLKVNENFIYLSKKLFKLEDKIVNSRKYFNCTIRDCNGKVEMFTSKFIAKILGYKVKKCLK